MKKNLLLLTICTLLISLGFMSFRHYSNTAAVTNTKKPVCFSATGVSNVTITPSGSSIIVSWSGSNDHYTVGGYGSNPTGGPSAFQVNCIYGTTVTIPRTSPGNLRITAFCGGCGHETSSVNSAAYNF